MSDKTKIIIVSDHAKDYSIWRVVELINEKLEKHNISIIVRKTPEREYDDNRVYRTGERQLAVRRDCSILRREATLY